MKVPPEDSEETWGGGEQREEGGGSPASQARPAGFTLQPPVLTLTQAAALPTARKGRSLLPCWGRGRPPTPNPDCL